MIFQCIRKSGQTTNWTSGTAEEILENGDQRIETEEGTAVKVESSSDIEENDSLDEYDSDETEDEEVIPDVNEDQNK